MIRDQEFSEFHVPQCWIRLYGCDGGIGASKCLARIGVASGISSIRQMRVLGMRTMRTRISFRSRRIGLWQAADIDVGRVAMDLRPQHVQLRKVVYVELVEA